MTRFLLRRLWHGAQLLLGASVLSFVLFESAPGSFTDELLASPEVPAEMREQVRRRFGLDEPLPVRYARWAGSTLRGDLGLSFAYDMPVSDLLWHRAARTLSLTGLALVLTWMVAVPLGLWAAARSRGVLDRAAGTATSLLVAVPDLLVGIGALWLAVRSGWFAAAGSLPLAALALALVSFSAVFRHTRASVAAVLAEPFVEHLRACGVPERRVLLKHVLPAALNPLISLFGLSLGSLVSAGLVIEAVLGWPGLGPLLLEAVLARDVHIVAAVVMLSTTLLLAGNLLADLLLYAADPRIRTGGA